MDQHLHKNVAKRLQRVEKKEKREGADAVRTV
jgi:hypothetical protein